MKAQNSFSIQSTSGKAAKNVGSRKLSKKPVATGLENKKTEEKGKPFVFESLNMPSSQKATIKESPL